ncbi:phosphoenolpyruvate carboxylase [Tribonema minus]|uniref:phosphoenolpyruvate carboxylase n=1 Tax=Tribonema minus TaxID=303371 RepID=A0A835YNR8_9STRA|nr:phosphoenolpyruvate carboxylase [Tribonema minus]
MDVRAGSTAAAVQNDVKQLGFLLGNTIQQHAPEGIYNHVEEIRLLARDWRVGDDTETLNKLIDKVNSLDPLEMKLVTKAFAHFLALANCAETFHRLRRLRQMVLDDAAHALPKRMDTTLGTITRLINEDGVSGEKLYKALTTQKVDLIFTAHPTEVNRRTMLHKHKGVTLALEKMHSGKGYLTPFEQEQLELDVQRAVESIWNSDEVRRFKPKPQDEARASMAVIDQVLWEAVPSWLRKLDAVLVNAIGKPLPTDVAPVIFGSWCGGDRDGNPNVTPEVTMEVSFRARWQAASLLRQDVEKLRMELSTTKCTPELREAAGGPAVREPYREIVKTLEARLERTLEQIDDMLKGKAVFSVEDLELKDKQEVLDTLNLLHRSLEATNQAAMANGLLKDVIRRVACFGLVLAPLDIRQESVRHSEALDAITRWLGVGSYLQWDEETRTTWLLTELNSKRPLLPRNSLTTGSAPSSAFDATVKDTLRTFETVARLGKDALGAYVISMCKSPSDVLAVKLLLQEFNVGWNMRVVPLFETLTDLEASATTMETLYSLPWYRGNINGHQEVMIGYSDSAKDAGRLAAAWAQFEAQERLASLAKAYNVQLTFFHGKGGTVSRGGNPALYQAITAQPPGTIQGRFRVTEQGEMITQNFGNAGIAERTLDIYTAGVLSDAFSKTQPPPQAWRDTMATLSDVSCTKYRNIVRHDPKFVGYFRASTPELELGALNIGSRPAKRRPTGGVETLRAIPWVFAWTQTRLNLPAWLGVGDALSAVAKKDKATLQEMYAQWPFFRTNIDLFEMILAKASPSIAAIYDDQLVHTPDEKKLGEELRRDMAATVDAVLAVSGNTTLIEKNIMLQWQLLLRNPYVDPLNIMQAALLRKLRTEDYANDEEKHLLEDALVLTINGISAGMRNTG